MVTILEEIEQSFTLIPYFSTLRKKIKHLSSQKEPMCDYGKSSGICQGMSDPSEKDREAFYSFSCHLVEDNILRAISCSIFTSVKKTQVSANLLKKEIKKKENLKLLSNDIMCPPPSLSPIMPDKTRVNVKRFYNEKNSLLKRLKVS